MSKPNSDDFNPLGTRFQKCRYFMMGTCKNGNKCHFMHFEPAAPKPLKKPVTSTVPIKPAVTSVVIPAVTRPVAKAVSSSEQQLQNEGEYFYGAPGSEPVVKSVGFQISFASMAANAGKTAAQSDGLDASAASEPEHKPTQSTFPESSAISSASAFVAAPSRKPCPFFARGTCRFGSACRDSHLSAVAAGSESPTCTYCHQSYTDGKTHFDQCAPYLIVVEERRLSMDVCCDICYELVLSSGLDAKFGILENCTHAFCLSCIRSWRASNQASLASPLVQSTEAARACPICRVESHFVIPSDRMVTSPESKAQLVNQYKVSTAIIPCRHFNFGRGQCAFGTSCFYSHQLEDGSMPVVDKPRFISDDSGNSKTVGKIVLADFLDSL